MVNMEEWRDIIGYEGLYQVSNLGRVRSLDREIITSNGILRRYKGKLLSQTCNNMGYYLICLGKGQENRFLVSRLVAQAFPEICGKWFEGCIIDHLNTNQKDNRPENLRVGTLSDNQQNPITKINKMYAKNNVAVVQCDLDGNIIKIWQSTRETDRFGFNHQGVISSCKGKYGFKTYKGFKWRYATDVDYIDKPLW